MRYYVQRVFQAIITFVGGLFLTYCLYRLMPGGPVQAIVADIVRRRVRQGRPVDAQEIGAQAERMTGINPEHGILEGFYNYVFNIVVYQDFGRSIGFSDPVFDVLFRAMPWSLFISGYGLILGFTATVLIGTLMAWNEGTKTDSGLTVFVLTMNSIPYYVGAIFMLVVLGFEWGVLPTGGRYPQSAEPGFNPEFMIGVAKHGAMPILSTFIIGFAGGSLGMRANTVRIMGSDYLRSARLRGLSTNRILTRYLARNAILPIYTGLVIGISGVFSSGVITEQIFQYPGVGWYMFEGLQLQDYPLIMGGFVFFAGLTVIAILIADLTYGLIDPRAGDAASRESF
ncbi:ABC transporter permease [Halomontanus rarus]|uniref:ABC transporter permease n=1 Tax=Halomontanus rarus TaxID=3034020 RepID=UPI0023E83567|nr:ABC transporter permease [Halovivax sp. TS33]